jgi:streptogramin lyase
MVGDGVMSRSLARSQSRPWVLAGVDRRPRRRRDRSLGRAGRVAAFATVAVLLALGVLLPLGWLRGLSRANDDALRSGSGTTSEPVDAPLRADAFQLEPGITGVATGFGSVWVVGPQQISRLDPATGQVVAVIPFGGDAHGKIAAGSDAMWATDGGASVIDPATNEVTATVTLGGNIHDLISGDEEVWISTSDGDTGRLVRVRPADERSSRRSPRPPARFRFTAGSVWILNGVDVVRVDPATMGA